MTDRGVQTWTLTIDGVAHRVEAQGGVRHHIRWYADGELVAEKKAAEDKLHLTSDEHGTLEVRYGALGGPRRAGIGGVDLEPRAGLTRGGTSRSGSAPTPAATPPSRRRAASPGSSYRSW